MNKGLSIYFDLVRFIAAVLVVHSHFLGFGLFPEKVAVNMFEFGREAVIIFFVMSGYVIAYTTEQKNHSLKEYTLARATRIYSVAIPIILLAFLIGALGVYFAPEKYADFYQLSKAYFYIPFHLLFLGETFVFYEKPFLVVPYWSLSYEVWYYVIFASVYFLRGKTRILVTSLLILFVGYRLVLLLPIWWAGVWLYHLNTKTWLKERLAIFLFLLSILLIVLFKMSEFPEQLRIYAMASWPDSLPPLGSAERFLSDYVYCILVMLNFCCAGSLPTAWLSKHENIIRTYASYTFTLYLGHMLIIEPYYRSFYIQGSWLNFWNCLVLVTLLTVALGEITEKRRYILKNIIEKLIANK